MLDFIRDPELDPGLPNLRAITVQRGRGNLQHWRVVVPAIDPELKAWDKVLGIVVQGEEFIIPRGSAKGANLAFRDLEDSVELLRLLIADQSNWESTFVSSFASMLSVPERLGLPGAVSRGVR